MKRLITILFLFACVAGFSQGKILTYDNKALIYNNNALIDISWSRYWSTRYPSELTATTFSDTQIDLAWTNNGAADYDGINIERSTDGINYIEIDTVAAGISVYSDTTCVEGTLYYYRVRYYKE